jgi:hypothetical protein
MQEKSATGPALSLEHLVTSGCRDGNCPTVYRTNRGTFVVQGYAVTPEQAGVDLPAGELLVEIPPDLLAGVVRILDGGRRDQPAPAQSNSVN